MTSRYQPVEGAAVVVEGEVPQKSSSTLIVNYAYYEVYGNVKK